MTSSSEVLRLAGLFGRTRKTSIEPTASRRRSSPSRAETHPLPASASQKCHSDRYARLLPSLRPGRYLALRNPAALTDQPIHPVSALATVLLAHVPAFDLFDEILYLVENASDLTLPDSVRCHFPVAILFMSEAPLATLTPDYDAAS
jgi:hypothetical protein